jgi:hypothetical protein
MDGFSKENMDKNIFNGFWSRNLLHSTVNLFLTGPLDSLCSQEWQHISGQFNSILFFK